MARFVELTESAKESRDSESAVANSAGVYALRNLTDVVPETTELVRNPAVRQIVQTILGSNAFLIRSTMFDKTDGANWGVFWHQDDVNVRHYQLRRLMFLYYPQDVTLDGSLRALYRQRVTAWRDEIEGYCLKRNVHYVPVTTSLPWDELVLFHLRQRGLVK